ncbi:hypothetical protein CAPTEDRAFT_229075 [Capitella teleta]|uniref:Small acidic protein n=1 Tax=Capitella teleta TaxID=283909 RepID=X2B1C1_CAPTE|nr:hypothetical protein CAPTEDRAFT_229075 [Capitella teleta]|eukprot:ELU00314.1 hypothetical protein CAPTEDRAFT_229075 [Capitella teleta]
MSSESASKEIKVQSTGKDAEKDNVQSANNWEGVDLGDADRKQKFLRLMGANKKTHQGTFVIGDNKAKHEAAGSRAKEVNEELEHQFADSLEHKLSGGARAHLGLGFHDTYDEDKEVTACLGDIPKDNLSSAQTQEEKDREQRKERKDSAKRDRSRSPVRKAADSTVDPESPSKSKFTMSFVKPSS